jgi:hypothetical protein
MGKMTATKLTPTQVTRTVSEEQKGVLPLLPLHFTRVEDLTTFSAEVAVTEGDAVYHFYVTKEANALPHWVTSAGTFTLGITPHKYWLELFPQVMEKVAREYFDADERRLVAAYTEEKASWWLRAKGAGMKLDPQRFALGFCDKLDAALESSMENAR